MRNNVKFVMGDEDIQASEYYLKLVFRFILGVGVCAFPHVLDMEESKKLPPTPPPMIISGTALSYDDWRMRKDISSVRYSTVLCTTLCTMIHTRT